MIAAVVTDKNERLRLSPRLAVLFGELLAMADDFEALRAGQVQVDIGPAELQVRFTELRPRIRLG